MVNHLTITKIELWPVRIALTDPFIVATGRMDSVHNLVVRITLRNGNQGYGEIAPFTDVTGETLSESSVIAIQLSQSVLGRSAGEFRHLASQFMSMAARFPATRCGLETALVDALCRSAAIPLWTLWGGGDVRPRETDITIPICDQERTLTLAEAWHKRGFRLFKMKVGTDLNQDISRIIAIHQHFPDGSFLIDANQGYSREAMTYLVKEIKQAGVAIVLLEQPVAKDDIEGLIWLRRHTAIPIAADESVCSVRDGYSLISQQAVDFFNLKITKSGLVQTLDLALLARAAGIRLMIGGMVETRIAMGCSFSLVLGLGGFEVLDLDTPLLLSHDPIVRGYQYEGPTLLPWQQPGLDLEIDPSDDVTVID